MGILLRIVIAALILQTTLQPQSASVEGRVISPSGAPVPRADINLIDPVSRTATPVSSVTADTEGKFVIAGIKPGVYKVRASREGFTTVEYGQKGPNGLGIPFTLATGQSLKNISITVVPKGAISGRIVDRNGMPAVRVAVQALISLNGDPKQERRFSSRQIVSTDEEGRFRLFGLSPGEYFVATFPNPTATVSLSTSELLRAYAEVNLARGPTLFRIPKNDGTFREEVEVPAFYPGTENANEATPVQVRGGEAIGGIEFSLKYSPVYRIRGIAANVSSMPGFIPVQLVGKQSIGVSVSIPVLLSGDAFEIAGVLPGDYRLNGLPIHVGDQDVENVDLKSTPTIPTIRGRVSIEPSPTGGNTLSSLGVFSLTGTTFGWNTTPRFLPDGTFSMPVVPDDYMITMRGYPSSATGYVKSARFGNQDALDVIHLEGNEDTILEVVLASTKASIEGRVIDSKHQPVLNAQLVLIPNAPQRSHLDRYVQMTTDVSGKFKADVIPGGYKLFAWEDVENNAWLNPDFMAKVESLGQPVQLREGSTDVVEVTVIPYVP